MRLVELKAVDNDGNGYIVFINPEYIESLYTVPNKGRTVIGMISGNPVEVNHTVKEVIGKTGLNIERTDYKRTDQVH